MESEHVRLGEEPWIAANKTSDRPLRIAERALARIRGEAWRSYPREACGLLLGRALRDAVRVEDATIGRNRDDEQPERRFLLDPRDWLQAELEAGRRGLEIVGVWHSHPDHPPRPSRTDHEAAWPDLSYLICRVTARRAEDLRSWRLDEGRFVEEPIEEVKR